MSNVPVMDRGMYGCRHGDVHSRGHSDGWRRVYFSLIHLICEPQYLQRSYYLHPDRISEGHRRNTDHNVQRHRECPWGQPEPHLVRPTSRVRLLGFVLSALHTRDLDRDGTSCGNRDGWQRLLRERLRPLVHGHPPASCEHSRSVPKCQRFIKGGHQHGSGTECHLHGLVHLFPRCQLWPGFRR